MTSICVFGAGAIGGFLAARLEQAGTPVNVVARGPHGAAIARDGLRLESGGTTITTRPHITADTAALGPQDYVVITLKAHSLAPALPQLAPLIDPHTTIVAGINGLPWWYFHGLDGPFRDRRIDSVDPGGAVWAGLPPTQTLGCIVYPAAEITEPGLVAHAYGDRFSLGEPDGTRSERAERLSQLMIAAGLKAPVRPRLRDELWVKLWGNMAFNPISALTTATLDRVVGEPGTRALARTIMLEGQQVAEALGTRFALTVDKRLDGAAEVGAHRTSMLQDLELGRPLEVEALLGAVVEVAQWVGIPVPDEHRHPRPSPPTSREPLLPSLKGRGRGWVDAVSANRAASAHPKPQRPPEPVLQKTPSRAGKARAVSPAAIRSRSSRGPASTDCSIPRATATSSSVPAVVTAANPAVCASAARSTPSPLWLRCIPVSPKCPLSSTTTDRFAGFATATVSSPPIPISASPSPVITATGRSGRASARPSPITAAPPMAPHR